MKINHTFRLRENKPNQTQFQKGHLCCSAAAGLVFFLAAIRAVRVGKKWTSVMMHREIIKVGDDMVVDHINHNGLDNRKANLRAATIAQNAWNRRRSKSRFMGMRWDKQMRRWRVVVSHQGKREHIGYFDDKIKAARAYDWAARKYHGQFAVLNFQS